MLCLQESGKTKDSLRIYYQETALMKREEARLWSLEEFARIAQRPVFLDKTEKICSLLNPSYILVMTMYRRGFYVASNNEYKRYFIILQEDDKGYEIVTRKNTDRLVKMKLKIIR
jgi:hypothetical protein